MNLLSSESLSGGDIMTKSTQILTQSTDNRALILDRLCDRSQILVTVKRNGASWLSPVGWVDSQKGTLLDCRPAGEKTEILIPEDYAAQIETGDKLHISCYELEFEQSLIWTANAPQPAAGAVSGLLGRLRRPKASASEPELSDTAKRAAELQREADEIRARVEAAKAAQEQAHQRALDAARLAEEARKAEDNRIAEMEQAKRALKEAEEARREELREIEEARRAEAARRAEEARLAEEARKLEEARRKQAVLREQRSQILASLDELAAQEDLAKAKASQLTLSAEQVALASEKAAKQAGRAQAKQAEEAKDHAALQQDLTAAVSKADNLKARADKAQTHVKEFSASADKLSKTLLESKTDWEAADLAAKEAARRAADLKSVMDKAHASHANMLKQVSAAKQEMASAAEVLKSAQSESAKAQLRLNEAEQRMAALKNDAETYVAAEQEAAARHAEVRAQLGQVEHELAVVKARRTAANDAVALIDTGADIDGVRAALKGDDVPAPPTLAPPETQPLRSRRFKGRRRAAAAASAPAAVLKQSDDSGAQVVKLEPKPKSFANDEDSSHDLRRALYAGVAAIAVVGITGFGVSKLWTASAEVPAKTVVAKPQAPEVTADVKAVIEAAAEPKSVEAAITPAETSDADKPNITKEALSTETADAALKSDVRDLANLEAAVKTPNEANTREPVTLAAGAEATPITAKKAAISPEKTAPKKTAAKQARVSASKKSVTAPKKATVKTPVADPQPAKTPAYEALTKEVQTRLQDLGFYAGAIDGKAGGQTDKAIIEFKTLFGLKSDNKISGEFLNALKTAGREVRQAAILTVAPASQAAPAQLPALNPAPVQPVIMQALPPVQTAIAEPAAPAPVIAAPQLTPQPAQPVDVASLTPIAAPTVEAQPLIADTVVEAKRLNGISGAYPSRAINRGFYDAVAVLMTYDVSPTGRVTNVQVTGLEPMPRRFAKYFERAGIDAVKGQRFSPKTVNGEPVASIGHESRLNFQVQEE